ncbi:hypothetical protein [Fusobacterium pseudoperiodonticum]|jgi:hypothetical protein|uniref:hypothetical protein n=1 Tax=Fusobacterium pseudoperiodonticum TaxID=2663009 RepID=UPI000C1C2FD2|nr:hypothetical protein [Fusobacterium pseudoperiodonticum]ATV63104.1 hypothetical protein CTM78_01010 [Fusobacterium pseudoperiodonticum]
MLYIPYINNFNEIKRQEKIIEVLENQLTKANVEDILIQDPYLYNDLYNNNFHEIFIEKKEYISDLDLSQRSSLWIKLFHKISDLNETQKEKTLKIMSYLNPNENINNNDKSKKINNIPYKKLKISILAENKGKVHSKIHDRFILLRTNKNKFFGIHIGVSLDNISKKDILFTKINEKLSKEIFTKFEERFNQGE